MAKMKGQHIKVRDLRLGDVIAEPKLIGSVIGLKLDPDQRVYITFVNRGLADRDPFEDLEIRAADDHVRIAPDTWVSLDALDDLEHEVGAIARIDDVELRAVRAIELHQKVDGLATKQRAATATGDPWCEADTERLALIVERLLVDVFGVEDDIAHAAAAVKAESLA